MLEHLSTFAISVISGTGYWGVFTLMFLESALIPIPSEVTMPFAGFLAFSGHLSFALVVLIGALGNLAGSLLAYALGYFLEEAIIVRLIEKYGRYLLLSKEEYLRSAGWYRKYGNSITFFSRLLPGVRTFISLPAGLAQMPVGRFSLYTFLGSLIWSGVLAALGFYLGSHWETIGPYFSKFNVLIAILLVAAIIYYIVRKRRSGRTEGKDPMER